MDHIDFSSLNDEQPFVIIPNVVAPPLLDTAYVNRQIRVVKRHGRLTFQVDKSGNDDNRLQYESNPTRLKVELSTLFNSLASMFSKVQCDLTYPSFLLSLEGCKQQMYYTRYNVDDLHLESTRKSYICFVALMDDTYLCAHRGNIQIPKGACLIARGDIEHACASYQRENLIIQFYADYNNCPLVAGREELDKTFVADKPKYFTQRRLNFEVINKKKKERALRFKNLRRGAGGKFVAMKCE